MFLYSGVDPHTACIIGRRLCRKPVALFQVEREIGRYGSPCVSSRQPHVRTNRVTVIIILKYFRSHKAVAQGAVSFYLSNIVTSRVSQLTYGSPCYRTYRPHHPEHVARSHKLVTRPSGELAVPGGFSTILTKVGNSNISVVDDSRQFLSIQTRVHEHLRDKSSVFVSPGHLRVR